MKRKRTAAIDSDSVARLELLGKLQGDPGYDVPTRRDEREAAWDGDPENLDEPARWGCYGRFGEKVRNLFSATTYYWSGPALSRIIDRKILRRLWQGPEKRVGPKTLRISGLGPT